MIIDDTSSSASRQHYIDTGAYLPAYTVDDPALQGLADVFAKRDLIGEIGGAFQCYEADNIALALLRLERRDAAAVLIAAHSAGDDEVDDEHRDMGQSALSCDDADPRIKAHLDRLEAQL